MNGPLVRMEKVVKQYQALRPLRVEALALAREDVLALMGLDAQAAEMFVGLLTGAVLPDAGDVELFGRSTRDVSDSDDWLAMLDGVGIITDRAVLIAQFTVEQNIAMPFTLQVDPLGDETKARVGVLSAEVGIDAGDLSRSVAQSAPEVVARVRLARALALNPTVLVAEHPSAALPRASVKAYAADIGRIARARRLAVLALTADDAFASALKGQVVTHEPATGVLRARSSWRKLFG